MTNFTVKSFIIRKLFKPKKESHKGENGIITIIAGSKQWHGASILAALAASYFVDLIYFLTEKENIPFVKKKSPLFIVSEFNKKNFKWLKKSDSILIGPGLSLNKKNKKLIAFILKKFKDKKIVLDASALHLIKPKQLHENCVITPHANEFKVLFKEKALKENVKKNSKKFNCLILLKGRIDVISNGKNIYFNKTGNQGMTKGGTGDVLAGLVTAFASKNSLLNAALAAAFLNGFAADLLYKKKNTAFNALDLVQMIPIAYKKCLKRN